MNKKTHGIFTLLLHPIHFVAWWQLLALMLLSLAIGVWGLRQNSSEMGVLKEQIASVDEAGGDVEAAVKNLSSFVFTHMNTSTEIELAATYNRAVVVAQKQAATKSGLSGLYDKALAKCRSSDLPLSVQTTCVAQHIEENLPTGKVPTPPKLPDERLYRLAFAAPRFSLDPAGLGLAFAGIFGLTWLIQRLTREYHLWLKQQKEQ